MKRIYVGAIGDIHAERHRDALGAVRECLGAQLDRPVSEIDLPPIEFALDERRKQYSSIAVLERLTQWAPPDAWKLLAVTGRDLFIPVLTFVYGQAQLDGRVGVISLARLEQEFYGLEPNSNILLDRARKEALHECGHTFGLVHCADRSCAMTLSTSIRQIDIKQAAFCAACGALLRRQSGETI